MQQRHAGNLAERNSRSSRSSGDPTPLERVELEVAEGVPSDERLTSHSASEQLEQEHDEDVEALGAECVRRARVAQRELDREGIYADGAPVERGGLVRPRHMSLHGHRVPVERLDSWPAEGGWVYGDDPDDLAGEFEHHGPILSRREAMRRAEAAYGSRGLVGRLVAADEPHAYTCDSVHPTVHPCVFVSDDRVELVAGPPLVAGGQGRSDEEVREDAEAAVFGLGLALLAVVGFASMAAIGFLIGRAV